MQVTKRDGTCQAVDPAKILRRIERICAMAPPLDRVDVRALAAQVVASIQDGIATSELDTVTAELAQPLALENPQYGDLAARVLVNNYHKNTLRALWTHFTVRARDAKYMERVQTSPGQYRPLPETIEQMEAALYYWTTRALWENSDRLGRVNPAVSPTVFLAACSGIADRWVEYSRDYQYDYAGFQMLETTYLQGALLLDGAGKGYRRPIERPQHMLLRVALGIHARATIAKEAPAELKDYPVMGYATPRSPRLNAEALLQGARWMELSEEGIAAAGQSYEMMSRMLFTHATPTLFQAGTMRPQLSSCYLLQPEEDSMEGIYDYNKECALISKWAGGIGSHVHNIRGHGAYIRGTNGLTNGVVGMLRVINNTSEYVNQGGKRPGTHAVYLGMTHPDIRAFLQLKKQRGNEQERARHLFYALWVSDEFMRCVVHDREWHLICPDLFREAYGRELEDLYDAEPCTGWLEQADPVCHAYTHAYRRAVADGLSEIHSGEKGNPNRLRARDLWQEIFVLLQETGGPYICFRDNVNRKSNHKHLGVVKSSNLCTEIMEYSSPTETAVCNLASICLPKFYRTVPGLPGITEDRATFSWELLRGVVAVAVQNLDRIVSINFYPNGKTHTSNMRHRPIGIGVQGLADLLCAMGLPYDSDGARHFEFTLFERMSYYAIEASCALAQLYGAHECCRESPLGRGLFQWDMWKAEQRVLGREALAYPLSMDWGILRAKVLAHGVRNSMLLALMPTASTSTIMGMSPCFEPFSSLVFKRRNRTGETAYINRHFVEHMIREGRWTPELRGKLLLDRRGSIADTDLPPEIKALYKTVWDLDHLAITRASIVRAPFICQSQSLNQFMERPTPRMLNDIYVLAWSRGLKTASYYTRRLAPADAQKIQVVNPDTAAAQTPSGKAPDGEVCTMQEGCVMCSS